MAMPLEAPETPGRPQVGWPGGSVYWCLMLWSDHFLGKLTASTNKKEGCERF